MAKEERLRSEIKEEYKWDLSSIYKNDELWYKDFEIAKLEVEKVNEFKKDFLDSPKRLLEYFIYDEKTDRLLGKLYFYAHLNFDSDTLDDNYKVMFSKISDLYKKYSELSSFVVPKILKCDYNLLLKYFDEEKKLIDYKFVLDEIYRFEKHTLSEKEELLLSNFSKCLSNPEETFEALTDSDMEFGKIKNEDGKLVVFNESNYSVFIKSKDRKVRKNAFNILLNKYKSLKNTIASCFTGNIEANIVCAKARNYQSAIKASLFNDNIDIGVYENLISVVNENLNVLYKYYDLKKDVLKLNKMHLYDIYADLIKEYDRDYSFDEAKDMVLDSLNVLGTDYVDTLKRAFDERWIDVYYNKGKRSGAYSSGFYDTNPFILLNYENKLRDVSTLAHELGHSMHTYYSCKNNMYQYSRYKIFVAEVASTVNELLLFNNMLKKSNNKEEKLAILNELMELFKSTIYRQTMFAEFEKDMYEKRENGQILTSDYISDNYYELVKKYFGPNVFADELIKYEWERIPHFYYDFYVYKYATGLSCACYIVDGILNNKENALNNYLEFLKTGGRDYPINELKIAGVDISSKEVILSAIKMFDNYINEFKEIYNS